MADKLRDHNATPPNDRDDGLRGGTQGGGGPNMVQPEGTPSTGRPADYSGGTRSGSRTDPEELFEGTRKPSPAVAKEWARDTADADTTHGVPSAPGNPKQQDETDPSGQADSDTTFATDGSLKGGGGHVPGQTPLRSGSEHPTARPGHG